MSFSSNTAASETSMKLLSIKKKSVRDLKSKSSTSARVVSRQKSLLTPKIRKITHSTEDEGLNLSVLVAPATHLSRG